MFCYPCFDGNNGECFKAKGVSVNPLSLGEEEKEQRENVTRQITGTA
jgi:hypothetical protein